MFYVINIPFFCLKTGFDKNIRMPVATIQKFNM